jgi:hypothetical protein
MNAKGILINHLAFTYSFVIPTCLVFISKWFSMLIGK